MSKTFSIFVKNKKVKKLFIFFMFCCSFTSFSQEFGAKFLTFSEETLPAVFVVENSNFLQLTKKTKFSKNLQVNASNYWNPVSMIDALSNQDAYLNRKNTVQKEYTAESLGFARPATNEPSIQFQVRTPNYSEGYRVKNTVYRDVSMPFVYPVYTNKGLRGYIYPYNN